MISDNPETDAVLGDDTALFILHKLACHDWLSHDTLGMNLTSLGWLSVCRLVAAKLAAINGNQGIEITVAGKKFDDSFRMFPPEREWKTSE